MNGCIMQNHGVFTVGSGARMATKIAIEVEEIAKITHLAMLRGRPIMLTEKQITELADMYYGIYGQG